MCQIFVAFSEHLNFSIKSPSNTKSACSYIPQLKTTKLINLITKPNV